MRCFGLYPSLYLVLFLIASATMLNGCATVPPQAPAAGEVRKQLVAQVVDTERAFARTMAQRDHAGFSSFLSQEAVFFSGPTPLHGKEAIAAWWKKFYEKPDAPFSWEPEQVEVLESGTLAMTSGPVYDPTGKVLARFTSVWRMEAPGTWRIVFDKGNDVCNCEKK